MAMRRAAGRAKAAVRTGGHRPRGPLRHAAGLLLSSSRVGLRVALDRDNALRLRRLATAASDRGWHGFGVGGGHWGGALCDQLSVPYADAMLVPPPARRRSRVLREHILGDGNEDDPHGIGVARGFDADPAGYDATLAPATPHF